MTTPIRAPFIWTPHQPMDPRGFNAMHSGKPPRSDGVNRWFLFRRRLDLSDPRGGALSITVDGRYIAWVNGERLGAGPVRSSPLFKRYDTHDLSGRLKPGGNVIAILVHTYGVNTAFHEETRGMWRPTLGDGGLWVEGQLEDGQEQVPVRSDAEWRCAQSTAWSSDTPRVNHGLGFIEDLDARLLPADWTGLDFDDGDWDLARPLEFGGGGPEAPYGGLVTRPFPTLIPSGIPHPAHVLAAAERVVWMRGQTPVQDLPLHQRIYQEPLAPLPDGAVEGAEGWLQATGADIRVRTGPQGDISVLLDFGRIVTGRPRIELEALGGEVVEIACAEALPGEWRTDGPAPDARITPRPVLGHDTHLCRYVARPGAQSFERFEWSAIRWMQVTVRNAPEGLRLLGVGAMLENYPVEARGRFTCSDPFLTRLWEIGAYTLRQCMHDAWEDCPSREQRQWLGDATVENLVGWAAFGPDIVPLNAKFLRQAAESQRPDGLTQMFAPGDHMTDWLLIPDWTLQWILNAGDHYRHSGDLETIEEILPSIQKALAWFERLAGPDGLVADMPYWHFMDWAGVGRHGQAATLNAQLAGAFRVAADLCRACGSERFAGRYEARAASIAEALHSRHWDEARGVFVDVVDPVTGAQEPRVSQHANAAIALWAPDTGSRMERALARITDDDRLTFTAAPPVAPTGETLDPENGVVLANTFYAHFVYEALAAHGRMETALDLMRQRYGPMLARGATTLWESFEPTASLCHAFSASPTWQLSRRILGVHPLAPGYAVIGVSPQLAGLEAAEGVFPTARGPVSVQLFRQGEDTVARIHAPPGVPTRFMTPPGHVQVGGDIEADAEGRAEARFRRAPG
jgi:hypothetical protein